MLFICFFNKVILNTFWNFLPQETLTIDDRDPPLFDKQIKVLLKEKNQIFKDYRRNKTKFEFTSKLNIPQNRLTNLITDSTQKYNIRNVSKLISNKKSTKVYSSLLKTFLNNRKILLISLVFHNSESKSDFKEQTEFLY